MEKGDEFICKNTIYELEFVKNETYKCCATINSGILYFENKEGAAIPFGIHIDHLYNYFYTDKELRKKKLDIINDR